MKDLITGEDPGNTGVASGAASPRIIGGVKL
jgi:hypothetical protein